MSRTYPTNRPQFWKYLRGLAPPVAVLLVLVGWLAYALYLQVRLSQEADEYSMREWLNEAFTFRKTLPDLVREYLELRDLPEDAEGRKTEILQRRAEEIRVHLRSLGEATKMYRNQLPLFPDIYYLEIEIRGDPGLLLLSWDSHLPRPRSQDQKGWQELVYPLLGDRDERAVVRVHYRLHAYNKWQRDEQQKKSVSLAVGLLATAAVVLALGWIWFFLRRERQRELQHLLAQQQIEHAERLVLENQLRRQEAEHKQEETERQLLEQRLAAQAAERQALELKSQLYASIGIMAGSYAHNIKNLLVRPNDLLRRCLEGDGLATDQQQMLVEVRQTLGTVTERLQQILRTVRRDPTRAELTRLDLNAVARDILHTWEELARDKWKLNLSLELGPEPLWVEADLSHLQQALENLLFNARDATFEMRNYLRDQARKEGAATEAVRRALIDAAAWRGAVLLRTYQQGDAAVLELQDNGIGMTEEVRGRCIETHFSTKRDNAIYEGISTGMGLGLSFVVAILEHHHAKLDIESEPLRGALFRVRFPPAARAPV
jgi:signal transduction histidine kinase